jgi:hypothetical protein
MKPWIWGPDCRLPLVLVLLTISTAAAQESDAV